MYREMDIQRTTSLKPVYRNHSTGTQVGTYKNKWGVRITYVGSNV